MMPRIMFVPMSWGRGLGPLTDCLALANELQKDFDLAFLVKSDFSEFIDQRRCQIYPITSSETHKRISQEFYTDFASFQGLDNEDLVRQMMVDEQKAFVDFKPSVIFSWLQFTTAITAKLLGITTIARANWPDHVDFIPPPFSVPIQPSKVTPLFNKLLSEYRMKPISSIWELSYLRSDFKLAPTLPEFEPELKKVPNLDYVGHLVYTGSDISIEPDWFKDIDKSKSVVYMYLSDKQLDILDNAEQISEIFDNTEFQLIISLGAHVSLTMLPPNTKNVRFERLLPADSILSKSNVFISTGTRGSTWNALLHGVSMVLFPGIDMEMGFNAQNIERFGAGVRLPDETFLSDQLLSALRKVNTPDYRKNSWALGEKMRKIGGPRYAADCIRRIAKAQ